MKYFFTLFIIVSLNVFAAEWTTLSSVGGMGHKIELQYDSINKLIKVSYRKGVFGKTRQKSYSVKNTILIDEVSSGLTDILKERKLPTESIEKIINEVQNLKYLDGSSCHIVNFNVALNNETQSLGPLVEEISKKLATGGIESHFLLNLQIENSETVELRAVTDVAGNIVQFSLFSEDKDLSKYKVVKENETYHVLNGNSHVFTLEIDSENKEHITVIKPIEERVQNVDRIHLRIKKSDKGLDSTLYSSNRQKKIKNQNVLDLRKGNVQFESVSMVEESDRFYKTLNSKEIDSVLQFTESPESHVEKSKEVFIRCMDEKYLISIEKSVEVKDSRESCINESKIELTLIELKEQYRKKSINSFLFSDLKKNFLTCLEKSNAMKESMSVRTFNHPISRYGSKINECIRNLDMDLNMARVTSKVKADEELNSLFLDSSKDELIQNLEIEFKECIGSKKSSSDCREITLSKMKSEAARILLFKELKDRKAQASFQSVKKQLQSCKSIDAKCVKNIYSKIREESNNNKSSELLKIVYPSSNYKLTENEKEMFDNRVSLCLESFEVSQYDSLESFSAIRDQELNCEIKAVLKHIPDISVKEILSIEPFSMLSKEDENRFAIIAKRKIKKAIRGEKVLTEVRSILDKSFDDLLPEFVDFYVNKRFEENTLNGDAGQMVNNNLVLSLNGNSGSSIKENVRNILKEQSVKRSEFSASVFIKDTLRNFEVHLFTSDKDEDQGQLFKDCMKEYSPKWKRVSLSSYVNRCENVVFADSFFKDKKEELEKLVSTQFSLTSSEANEALTPIHYLEECISKKAKINDELQSYERVLNSCFLMAKLDVLSNLSEQRVRKNTDILGKDGDKLSIKASRECFQNFYINVIRSSKGKVSNEELSQLKNIVLRNDSENGVNKLMSMGHSKVGQGSIFEPNSNSTKIDSFISFISDKGILTDQLVEDYSKKCTDKVDTALYNGFKDFIVQNISASFDLSKNSVGETNKEIIESVFDQELLSELLKLTEKRKGKGQTQADPKKFSVSGELGVESLANLVSLIGEYISKGFVFDKDLMKTELVVFRAELKNALKWLNTTDKEVSLEELQKFFTSTKLADLMAYATVSEQVYNRFDEFITKNESSEKAKLRKKFGYKSRNKQSADQRKEWDRMILKFSRMRREAKSVTSSYDFRRLFRDGSKSSQENLSKIKANYLLPLITKGKTSEASKNEVMKIVADLILKDNSKGGFAEKFVGTAATEYLENKSDGHWAITKWLFYDDGDFKWSSLKSTKSGAKAIDYYGKYILLPEILKKSISSTSKTYRLNHFKKLLKKAQGENDD